MSGDDVVGVVADAGDGGMAQRDRSSLHMMRPFRGLSVYSQAAFNGYYDDTNCVPSFVDMMYAYITSTYFEGREGLAWCGRCTNSR